MVLSITLLQAIHFSGTNSAPRYTRAAPATCGGVFYGCLKRCMGRLSFFLFPKKPSCLPVIPRCPPKLSAHLLSPV